MSIVGASVVTDVAAIAVFVVFVAAVVHQQQKPFVSMIVATREYEQVNCRQKPQLVIVEPLLSVTQVFALA